MEQNFLQDHSAFDELVLCHWDHALLFCFRILNDFHAAEDIVQESFAAAYFHRSEFDASKSFKPWLYGIIRNKSLSYLRKKRFFLAERLPDISSSSLEDLFLEAAAYEELFTKIQNLKPNYRMVLTLVDYEGLSYHETATALGWTQSKVKSSLFRARKALAKQLKGEIL